MEENPYAAPTSSPAPLDLNDNSYELATLGQRFLGSIIDGLIITIPIVIILWSLHSYNFNESNNSSLRFIISNSSSSGIIYSLIGIIINILIQWKFLVRNGQTIGKIIMKTKIVDNYTHEKPTINKLVIHRYLLPSFLNFIPIVGGFFPFINAVFIFGRERRCIHDHFAETKVIKTQQNA